LGVTCSASFAHGFSATPSRSRLVRAANPVVEWLAAAPAKEAFNGIPAGEFEKGKEEGRIDLGASLSCRRKGADATRSWFRRRLSNAGRSRDGGGSPWASCQD